MIESWTTTWLVLGIAFVITCLLIWACNKFGPGIEEK